MAIDSSSLVFGRGWLPFDDKRDSSAVGRQVLTAVSMFDMSIVRLFV